MVTFLMIARVLYDKGFQQYVDAAKIIKRNNNNTRFWLLGDIDEQYPNHVPLEVVEEYDRGGIIDYLGYKENVIEIMKDADCIVHPSYYNEGMSRVLMEALALRRPIITTAIPGCMEFVVNGMNGFLCEPRDTDSLCNAINLFLETSIEKRCVMGEEGRKLAEQRYDIRKVISVYYGILKNRGL